MSPEVAERVLFIDPWSGAAGDMLLAALLELLDHIQRDSAASAGRRADSHEKAGRLDPEETLRACVRSLGLEGVTVKRERSTEFGFACSRVKVEVSKEQPVRAPEDVVRLIEASTLEEWVRHRSISAVRRLASVEAALHGLPVEDVHLHELGAVDTAVDVVGFFRLVRELGVDRAVAAPVPLGSGRIVTEHGVIGVPAPATVALLEGWPVWEGETDGELTTPTGALLITEIADRTESSLPAMRIEGQGFGAGRRRLENRPNLLRLMLGRRPSYAADERQSGYGDEVVVLTTNLDDVTGETMGHLTGRLLEQGARDAYWTPVYMKKSRPGAELTVLCLVEDEERIVDMVFDETGTFGMRREVVERRVLRRELIEVELGGFRIHVKAGWRNGRLVVLSPEFEDCRRAAEGREVPLRTVMEQARRLAERALNDAVNTD